MKQWVLATFRACVLFGGKVRLFGRFALASGVPTRTIDVRGLFHRRALGAAILARRDHT